MQDPKNSVSSFTNMDREYFNQYAKGYSVYTPADIDVLLGDILPLVRARKIKWMCEVGSADGQISLELTQKLEEKVSVVGMDIAEKVLKLYPFNRLCGDAFQMPLPDASLDFVCYPATLHHLAPFSSSLAELNRVLSPGGLVYFLEPNYFHPQRRFFMRWSKLYHLYRQANDTPVNPDQLSNTLTGLGFDVLLLRYVNIHFIAPGILQTIQNTITRPHYPEWLNKYVMPWFVLIGIKR